jgi:NADH:ubiquinone oxidoreductase subunit E
MMMSDRGLQEILDSHKAQNSSLITVLHHVQKELGYFSEETAVSIAKELDIPLNRVYSVITFYERFSLTPKGEHTVMVCEGTACHIRGGKKVLDEVEKILGIKAGETTEDLKFSVERVACLGCCALAPTMVIDNKTYGKLVPKKVGKALKEWEK